MYVIPFILQQKECSIQYPFGKPKLQKRYSNVWLSSCNLNFWKRSICCDSKCPAMVVQVFTPAWVEMTSWGNIPFSCTTVKCQHCQIMPLLEVVLWTNGIYLEASSEIEIWNAVKHGVYGKDDLVQLFSLVTRNWWTLSRCP